MAWTHADRDRLKRAMALGATEVRHGDKVTRYRSLNDMRQTLALIEKELGVSRGRRIRSFVIHNRRGW
ncbi:phage head-tail joining protein [Fodinicurvata sp. EGI_FJ10296]|uniref:phage head-tail joining protein n=1 Tax=Fodinicurvata sp. EGI_FJ10296 TaxID=3231908 RepID=UPI0034531D40